MVFSARKLTAMMCALSLFAACTDDNNPTPPEEDMSTAVDMPEDTQPDVPVEPDPDLGEDMADDGVAKMDMQPIIEPDLESLTAEQRTIAEIERTEAWTLDGLTAPVHVVFTEHNRPHVYAQTREDLGQVLGFIVARDRYFVMDLQRRLAQGTISALLGDAALANDIESRMIGMDAVTQRLVENLSAEDAAYFDAYARGINAYIERVRAGELPAPSEIEEFAFFLRGGEPVEYMEPFTRRDIAAMVAVIMYETNFETGDIGRAAKLARLDALYEDTDAEVALRRQGAIDDVWEGALAPLFDVRSASGWEIEGMPEPPALRGTTPPVEVKQPRARALPQGMVRRASRRMDALRIRLGRRELDNFGSNTWAVQGTKTRDGAGLVAGDGHLPLSIPALMYQAGLDTETFAEVGGLRQTGLLITSLPLLAVGTNGDVAWSQVNPFADIVDYYHESITLGADGAPVSSLFDGTERPLEQVDEVYDIARARALGSQEGQQTWSRWKTFDGRLIYDIEGTEVESPDMAEEGAYVVNLAGRYVVPGDANNDGEVSAISFDYTAFDTTQYIGALSRQGGARDVWEYQEETKGFVGNTLYSAATDAQGNILFSSYQAVPCRTYLARDADGEWVEGANPRGLLDGTTYGGFTIPSGADGKVDESLNDSDPYRCVVPFDETPQAINPPQGYLVNANNQPAPITDDASLSNDPWYIGGPWRAVRADSIEQGLIEVTQDASADVDAMARIQGDTRSRTGEMFVPALLAAIDMARGLSQTDGPLTPEETRLAAAYDADAARLDEVAGRLQTWRDAGYPTPTGVETFYHEMVTPEESEAAVATMIFNAWLPRVMNAVFADEDLEYPASGSVGRMRVLKRMLDSRGDNAMGLSSYSDTTGESVFFDVLGTPDIERSDEVMLGAMTTALDWLSSAPTGEAQGGFGTDDMSAWLWGLRHQVRFESLLADFLGDSMFGALLDPFSITTKVLPLAEMLGEDDPRADLKWFPRPGDNFAVDAANPGFGGTDFTYGSGPVMRMVIALKDGEVSGQNIIPGGQSGLNDSPYFADQAAKWLGNETVPLRYTPEEVAAGAMGRAYFQPRR